MPLIRFKIPGIALEGDGHGDVGVAGGYDGEGRHRRHVVGGLLDGASGQVHLPEPSKAVKITKNMSGKAKVKKADAGLRQNALLTYPT